MSALVHYTWTDDGIWLVCDTCDHTKNFGYHPKVDALAEAQNKHYQTYPCSEDTDWVTEE